MRRLIHTSAGAVVVELDRYPGSGIAVGLIPFDAEGWEVQGRRWSQFGSEHGRQEPLAQFIEERLGLPAAEARTLADEIFGPWLDEWVRRGESEAAERASRWAVGTMIVLPIVVALALLGVALLIWVIVT